MIPSSQYAGRLLWPATPPLPVTASVAVDVTLAPPVEPASPGENSNSGELHAVATKNVPAAATAKVLKIRSTRGCGTVGRYHTDLDAAMGAEIDAGATFAS